MHFLIPSHPQVYIARISSASWIVPDLQGFTLISCFLQNVHHINEEVLAVVVLRWRRTAEKSTGLSRVKELCVTGQERDSGSNCTIQRKYGSGLKKKEGEEGKRESKYMLALSPSNTSTLHLRIRISFFMHCYLIFHVISYTSSSHLSHYGH